MLAADKQELTVHARALHFAALTYLALVWGIGFVALERTHLRVPAHGRDGFDRCAGHVFSTFCIVIARIYASGLRGPCHA
jgi:hypothetical protein